MTKLFAEGVLILLPLQILGVIVFLVRGHDLPGGGFIAGVLGLATFIIYGLVWRSKVDPVFSELKNLSFLGPLGILVTLGSGFLGYLIKGELFACVYLFNVLGFKFTSEFVFDFGIFLTVLSLAGFIFFELLNMELEEWTRD